MYVWVVRRGKERCVWLSLKEAWPDFLNLLRNNDRALIYPKFMFAETYETIRDFEGW